MWYFHSPGCSSFDYEQLVQFRKKDLCSFHIESVNTLRKVQEPIRGPCSDTRRVKRPFKESELLLLCMQLKHPITVRCLFLSVNKTKWKATATPHEACFLSQNY